MNKYLQFFSVFMRDNTIYWDEKCKIAVTKIYQKQDDDSRSLYLDENLQNQLTVRELPANQSAATSSSRSGDIVSITSTSASIQVCNNTSKSVDKDNMVELPVLEAFSIDEILYLIDMMREYATKDDELPRSIQELESRISRGRGQKKQMWREVTTDLTSAFK